MSNYIMRQQLKLILFSAPPVPTQQFKDMKEEKAPKRLRNAIQWQGALSAGCVVNMPT